ncbi:MAG: hypothetical protein L6V87_08765 [Ruminococcus sp.]|nr:MAG: hypothetical protein L6V87_08765 [Ruminococcus sp.]
MKKLCCLIAVAVFVFTLSGRCFAVENEPQVSAKAAVIIEAGTGRVVFGKKMRTQSCQWQAPQR